MHIITGLIMASLLKRGKNKEEAVVTSPLLKLAAPVRTRHILPGRARFEVPALRGDQKTTEELAVTLQRIESVEAVRVSPVTGSVLLCYDPDTVSPELLVAAIIKLLRLDDELNQVPPSIVGREFHEVSHALNRAVYDKTGGIIDLRTALFIALAAVGVTRLRKGGMLALPAGFTLLWWAGNGLLGKRGGSSCST